MEKGPGTGGEWFIQDNVRRYYRTNDTPTMETLGQPQELPIDTDLICALIADEDPWRWVKDFLAPRSFKIKTFRVIGEASMTFFFFFFYILSTHMWPQREGYDEPEPTGHPDSARAMYNFGWSVNRLPRVVQV